MGNQVAGPVTGLTYTERVYFLPVYLKFIWSDPFRANLKLKLKNLLMIWKIYLCVYLLKN